MGLIVASWARNAYNERLGFAGQSIRVKMNSDDFPRELIFEIRSCYLKFCRDWA
jgi:hypothetical protein